MELIKLLGVLIVIVGFALKLDSILIIFLALITTGLVGGLGIGGLLETIGTNFVANRSMAIFIMILLVTGVLERNGLREAAADLIKKVKGVTAGKVVAAYGIMRGIFGAFNVGFGGVAGFIRPVVLPMAEAAIENGGNKALSWSPRELLRFSQSCGASGGRRGAASASCATRVRGVIIWETEILSRRVGVRSMTTGLMERRATLGAHLPFLPW